MKPVAEVEGCRAAHRQLAEALDAVTDEVATGPSLMPGWNVAHVLSHLANNAEAMIRRIEAAQHDQLIEQYPGGAEGQANEIDANSKQPTATLVSRVIATANQLDSVFETLADDDWRLPVRTVAGQEHPLGLLPFRRRREVEVHHADLDIGFTPEHWSPGLIDRALPRLLDGLDARTDRKLSCCLDARSLRPANSRSLGLIYAV